MKPKKRNPIAVTVYLTGAGEKQARTIAHAELEAAKAANPTRGTEGWQRLVKAYDRANVHWYYPVIIPPTDPDYAALAARSELEDDEYDQPAIHWEGYFPPESLKLDHLPSTAAELMPYLDKIAADIQAKWLHDPRTRADVVTHSCGHSSIYRHALKDQERELKAKRPCPACERGTPDTEKSLLQTLPGLDECRLILRLVNMEQNAWDSGFQRMMEDEFNDGAAPPSIPTILPAAVRLTAQKYPEAMAFAQAERTLTESNWASDRSVEQALMSALAAGKSLQQAERAAKRASDDKARRHLYD